MTTTHRHTTTPALLLALAVALAACSGVLASQDVDRDVPPAEDLDGLPHGEIFVDGVELHLDGTTGRLRLTGNLPTPCHMAMWTVENGHERIEVEIWTVFEPEVVCSQVLQPFDVEVSLGEIDGAERVFLDGEEIGLLRA